MFAGLVFGRQLFHLESVARAGVAFVVFCALSSTIYLLNDVADRDNDRRHPLKRDRPIASGALSLVAAFSMAGLLGAAGLGVAAMLGWRFFLLAAAFVAMFGLYSAYLKHFVIVDVLVIAFGFVLRASAGAVAIDVEISHWLLVCTFLLALFMALAKRRHELVVLADVASIHRPSLEHYETTLLDQMIAITAASAIVAYVFYSINSETELRFGTHWLSLTIPFPIYGIFRYLYLVHRKEGGGNPADLLLFDRPLLACVVVWALVAIAIIYHIF